MADLWVFGYGSLMWNPGFPFTASAPALLRGAHRSLCIYSWVHRGTPDSPGLVLGLDAGGACRGVAFRVAAGDRDAVLEALRARELVTAVYLERVRKVDIEGVGRVEAVTYVADRSHAQYAGRLSLAEQLPLVQDGHGRSGPNRDYVVNTVMHLRELGIQDHGLEVLAQALDAAP